MLSPSYTQYLQRSLYISCRRNQLDDRVFIDLPHNSSWSNSSMVRIHLLSPAVFASRSGRCWAKGSYRGQQQHHQQAWTSCYWRRRSHHAPSVTLVTSGHRSWSPHWVIMSPDVATWGGPGAPNLHFHTSLLGMESVPEGGKRKVQVNLRLQELANAVLL